VTRFVLSGAHKTVQCASCHRDRRLRGIPMTCAGCHRDPHQGRLGTACEKCHTTTAFSRVASFDHDATRFPLRGAHRVAKCDSCHGKGRALKFARFEACGDCHRDVHAGQLGPKPECATCHSVERFVPSLFTVQSHQRTRFPLGGAHLAVACNQCHTRSQNVTRFRFESLQCAGCHRDPHRGETARYGSCETCHRVEGWRGIAFDHARTGFVLDGAHARAACGSCHRNGFKGVPRQCAACHGKG
jgi:hypothetical protein